MKKVISLFLSLAMLLSIVSVVDFSAFADVQTGSCGDNVTYSLDTETGVLTISGTGKMTDYSAEDCPFNNRAYIKSVIIENGVISIGNYAFSYFGSLTNVTIPNSVTSIGYDAFNYCKSLTSVTIPDSVTSIGEVAFCNCTSLTSVTIPNSVTSIGDCAFEDCYFTFENFVNNSNVELNDSSKPMIVDTDDKGICIKNNVLVKMRPAYAIGEVTIPNTVTSIGDGAFDNCESLTSVAIPDSVTSIGSGAFYDCTNLANVYYAGAEDEWNNITISDENEDLTNATIHFSSTPPPKPTPTPTPEPTPTPNPAPQPSTQPTQETQQQVAQQTAQQQSVKNDTAAKQVNVAKPKSVSPKKVKSAKKAVSVEWKKVRGVKGYQIQVATDKKFKKNKKTVTIKKQKTTKTTVKKLKAKKKYYVRVRTYKIVNGKKVYSAWSKVKSVKTK